MRREIKKYRKKQSLRFKRMDPIERIENAKLWLKTYKGEEINIVKKYKKKYGIGWERAFEELQILGVKIDKSFIEEKLEHLKTLPTYKERKNQNEEEDFDDNLFGEDSNFSFIAGHTSNGIPFGISRDE